MVTGVTEEALSFHFLSSCVGSIRLTNLFSSLAADSPPPKPPGRRTARKAAQEAAQSSKSARRGFRLNASATDSVIDFLGVDPKTATASTINEKILSLSDHRSTQMEPEGRYTQVRGETPAPLSPLSQDRGGYHRDKLLALGHPTSSNNKRPLPDEELGSSKRARFKDPLTYTAASNPAFGGDVLSLPSFTQLGPTSASSTQRAAIGTFGSQHKRPRPSQTGGYVGFGIELTPVPEPRDAYAQLAAPRATSPAPCVSVTEPRASSPKRRAQPPKRPAPVKNHVPPKPRVLVPGTPSRSPTPEAHLPKPPLNKQPHKLPPPGKNPDAAIESGSESEPVSKPKPKSRARNFVVGRAGGRSSQAVAGPSACHRQHTPPRRRTSPVPPTRHHGTQAVLDRLGDILNGGGGDDSDDTTLDHVIELLMQRRQRSQPSSSHHQPSSSRRHSSSSRHRTLDTNEEPAQSSDNRTCNTDRRAATESDSDPPTDLTKNGLGRYPGKRGKVASHAIPHLLAVAIRKGIFQDKKTYFKWADKEYIRAWKRLYPRVKYKPPTTHLLRLMILRISGLRTEVKKRVRVLVAHLHQLRNPGSSERRLKRNQQLCRRLLPNAFHCLACNLNADEDYYQHEHLFDAISEALFSHPDSPVINHHKEFMLMPLPAVSFVLTMLQDCLEEWDTGCLRVRDNRFRQQKAMFDAHLHGLHTYKANAPGRLARLQSKWFLAGMKHAGIHVAEGSEEQLDPDNEFCQAVTQACYIRADSDSDPEPEPEPEPEPDSESEPEPEPQYNEHGCMTAQSKGKGKATASNHIDNEDDLTGDSFEEDYND
ncbi:hypothetical protein FRC12_003450 [Ceratobasidium sp. 428]|nr:hypothetical protein FRC12_003450 [Ceratobasidium sp. 428]